MTLKNHRYAHTAIFKMDNQQRPIILHREVSSMLCSSLDRRGFGGEGIHVYVAEPLVCPLETITTLLMGYTPIQNKKLKTTKKKISLEITTIQPGDYVTGIKMDDGELGDLSFRPSKFCNSG